MADLAPNDTRAQETHSVLARSLLRAVALVITLSVNVPIDNAIARWTIDTLPADWSSIRNRWEAYHAARTFVSLAGFGCALAAVLWWREGAAVPLRHYH